MKTKGTEYIKPYSREIFGTENLTHYAYPEDALRERRIFPFFVLDGGAAQLLLDRFGTIDSDELLRLTMSGELFREFENGSAYCWERSFAYTSGTDFTPKYEWQIWPQRLYMTIPIAHAFLKSGDRKYADRWLEIVRGWDKAHPYQPFDPDVNYLKTDMVWRDMQVAWRTMSLLHGIFMLKDAPFSMEDWRYIYDFIELHVNHMYEEALDRLRRNHAQNHVLQIGVVLIMAAVMFPELEASAEILRIGKDTVRMNMQAIYPDGGSNEDSPSYSHFIARLYLEAYLLLKNNGLEGIDGLLESVTRQYEWIYNMSSPGGRTVQISDSYSMDSVADLELAEMLADIRIDRKRESRFFADSGVAVMKKGALSLYVDAMAQTGGHRHFGRPEILLYHGDRPVIVDGGCCSYDRWEMYLKLRLSEMHNVIYCTAFDDERSHIEPRITEFDKEAGVVCFESRVECDGRSYTWRRRLSINDTSLDIEDSVSASEPLPFESRLFFARRDTKVRNDRTVCMLTEDHLMTITCDKPIRVELRPIMNGENRIDYAITAERGELTDSFSQHTTIVFEDR